MNAPASSSDGNSRPLRATRPEQTQVSSFEPAEPFSRMHGTAWQTNGVSDRLSLMLLDDAVLESAERARNLGAMTHDASVPLSARLGLRTAHQELAEGVPDWLLGPLLDWLQDALGPGVVDEVALHVRISLLGTNDRVHALRAALEARALESEAGRHDVLDAVDHLLRIYWHELMLPTEMTGLEPVPGSDCLSRLDSLLARAGSAYRVASAGRWLERRVDDTVRDAVEYGTKTGDVASRHLANAWSATYGRDPDPTKAYGEAVRAVEAAACPLVLPKDPTPTLGKVIGHLRHASDSWVFVIQGKNQATGIAPIVAMLELLWTGQTSRHSGGPETRPQTQDESEAAVHLAATLLQWLTAGFLRRNEAP